MRNKKNKRKQQSIKTSLKWNNKKRNFNEFFKANRKIELTSEQLNTERTMQNVIHNDHMDEDKHHTHNKNDNVDGDKYDSNNVLHKKRRINLNSNKIEIVAQNRNIDMVQSSRHFNHSYPTNNKMNVRNDENRVRMYEQHKQHSNHN